MVASVLIVEDNDYIRGALEKMAKDNGYKTKIAINEKEAKTKIKKEKYNIVIIDMNIRKEKGGFEVIKAARDKCSSTQVIVISGIFEEDIGKKYKEAGAFSFVRRDSDFQDFCEKVFSETKKALIKPLILEG